MAARSSTANSVTPEVFAATVLHRLGIHQTPGAVQALTGWVRAEGGHWNNSAKYNPLNTTQPMPGAGNTGAQGNIKVYRNWDQGIAATVDTLKNGRYQPILRALQSGNPNAVAAAIGQTPWGTSGSLVQKTIANTPRVAGVHALGAGAGGTSTPQGQARTVSSTKTVGAVDNSRARGALIASFLEGGSSGLTAGSKAQGLETTDPLAFAQGIGSLKDNPGRKVTTTRTVPGSGGPAPVSYKGGSAVGSFEGRKVAGWIAPILQYARQHGWKGQVTSGYRSFADQQRIYNSGVRPAAKPGTSNHEFTAFPGGAIDASDAATLSRILRGSPYAKKLVWAGSKDPVHFSHPHGGSY